MPQVLEVLYVHCLTSVCIAYVNAGWGSRHRPVQSFHYRYAQALCTPMTSRQVWTAKSSMCCAHEARLKDKPGLYNSRQSWSSVCSLPHMNSRTCSLEHLAKCIIASMYPEHISMTTIRSIQGQFSKAWSYGINRDLQSGKSRSMSAYWTHSCHEYYSSSQNTTTQEDRCMHSRLSSATFSCLYRSTQCCRVTNRSRLRPWAWQSCPNRRISPFCVPHVINSTWLPFQRSYKAI